MPQYLNHFKDRHKEMFQSAETEKRLLELAALFEISQTLSSTLDLKTILDNILLVPMGRMLISRGLILFAEKENKYKVEYLKGLPETLLGTTLKIDILPDQPFTIHADSSNKRFPEFFRRQRLELIIPLLSQRNFKGLIAYGPKLSGKDFSIDEINFLASLAHISVQSIENARIVNELNMTNRSLDQKIQELNTLFEIGRELNLLFEQKTVLKQLAYALMGQMLTNQFFVALKEERKLSVVYQKGKHFGSALLKSCLDFCTQHEVLLRQPLLCLNEPQLKSFSALGIRAIVPMQIQEENRGFIFLGGKMTGADYTQADLEFLSTLANMTVSALENARLIEQRIEKERLEEELSLARTIQAHLLPATMPQLAGYSIHGLNLPSKQVGGDYFDVIRCDDTHYIFTIADVSGKGMPAALLMSNLQAGLQVLSRERYELPELSAKLNELIYRNTSVEKYITFFILKLNIKDGSYRYVNAGHNPPYIFSADGSFTALDLGGTILGMFPEVRYRQGSGRLAVQDCLTMFTDGITEAQNKQEDFFDEQRLINFFKENFRSADSERLNRHLLEIVGDFTQDSLSQDDDITLLTIKRNR